MRVAVLGAAGTQAGAMLEGLSRAMDMREVVAVDRRWAEGARQRVERLGVRCVTADILADREVLAERLSETSLVVNLAGPFYALGTAPLELAIDAGVDYLDICDDSDATEELLTLDAEAQRVGIRAVIGLGSTPGMSNVLIRTALDALPDDEARVDIAWTVDAADMSPAVLEHMFHCFATAVPDSSVTPPWPDLRPETVGFPAPVGKQEVVLLGHPEPITIPHFTRAKTVVNKGGISPHGHLEFAWLLAGLRDHLDGQQDRLLFDLYAAYREASLSDGPSGSGLQIDVVAGDRGYRFASGADTSMEEATGVPAAAGALLMLEGDAKVGPGVSAPECLDPRGIFEQLRRVSRGGGGLHAMELRDGVPGNPVRIRDLLGAVRR